MTGHFTEIDSGNRKHHQRRRAAEWGRPKHASRAYRESVTAVDEMVLSQQDQTQTHRSTRQISTKTGLTQSSVTRIIHRDIGLKCFFRLPKRLFTIIVIFSYI